MELILYTNISKSKHFLRSALEIGFDEFVARKFIYIMQDTDLDVLQLMGDERLHLLLYGWEIVNQHMQTISDANTIPENVLIVIKKLTHYSLDIWFAKEWCDCKEIQQLALIYCLKRARAFIECSSDLKKINWDYLCDLDIKPWSIDYLHQFLEAPARETNDIKQVVETVENEALEDDILFLNRERFTIIILRLMKMFDAGALVGVKNLAMRVIVAWNHEFEQKKQNSIISTITDEDKRCLILICHIYLMSIYEMDDERGFAIDNIIHSIRFYCRNLKEALKNSHYLINKLSYTSALYIATTCYNLDISAYEFFEIYIFDSFDEYFTTLFGAISQAYLSYIIGNMLMELNNQNEEDFEKNVEYFKRLINLYVPERERSELFMLGEMRKQELQRNSHSECDTVKNITNFKSKICKGNRMSNIGGYEENDKIEPVFQNLPNNQNILNYVYDLIAKRNYKGWHLAKVVLLLKLIGHELNMIETWRYHPGLSVDFMLSLETKLSLHFMDLAQIFQTHPFIEREFWLTAFYLNPCKAFYGSVIRCGLRFHRRRQNDDQQPNNDRAHNPRVHDKNEQNSFNAKFGLLSSTIDVKEIVELTNQEAPTNDYEKLEKALEKFRLPDNMIKDLLTVAFLPRNKAFAWAVHWPELRKRCKTLVKHPQHKRNLVELNMAEANDRLKFLHINYDKYKHRPQLDYGTIEQGYENINSYGEDDNSIFESDDDDFDVYEKIKKTKNVKKPRFEYVDKNDDDDDVDNMDCEDDDDDDDEVCEGNGRRPKTDNLFNMKEFHFSTRRKTRARTAAAIASARHELDEKQIKLTTTTTTTSKSNGSMETETVIGKEKITTPPATLVQSPPPPPAQSPPPTQSPPPIPTIAPPVIKSNDENVTKIDLRALLNERTTFSNATNGFTPFPDIWDIDTEQKSETSKAIELFETQNLLQKFSKCRQTATEENTKEIHEKSDAPSTNNFISDIENSEDTLSAQETLDYLENTEWNVEKQADNITNDANTHVILQSNEMNVNSPQLYANDDDDCDSLLSETSTSAVKDSGEINDFSKDDDDDDDDDDDEADEVDADGGGDGDGDVYKNDNECNYEVENANENTIESQNVQVNENVHVAINVFDAEMDINADDAQNMEIITQHHENENHKIIVDEKEMETEHEIEETEKVIETAQSVVVKDVEEEVEKHVDEQEMNEENIRDTKMTMENKDLHDSNFSETIQMECEIPKKNVEHQLHSKINNTTLEQPNILKKMQHKHQTEIEIENNNKNSLLKTTKTETKDSIAISHDNQNELRESPTPTTSKAAQQLLDTAKKTFETSKDREMIELKLECTKRQAVVQLKRLNVADLTNIYRLRQPRVRVERINEKLLKDQKRKRRCRQLKSYIDCYDSSSNSTHSQTKRAYTIKHIRKRSHSTSASSLASDECLAKHRTVNNDVKRTVSESKRHSAQRGGKSRKMIVTPRSASGLKLRIAAMKHSRSNTTSTTNSNSNSNSNSKQNTPEPEYIQILSSSDDEQISEIKAKCALKTITTTTTTTTTTAPIKDNKQMMEADKEDLVKAEEEIEELEVEDIEEVVSERTANPPACATMQVELVEEENASIVLNPIVDDENVEIDDTADPLYYDQFEFDNMTYSISFL